MYIGETINNVTSTEVPCTRPNVSTTFSELKMNNLSFCVVEVGFYNHLWEKLEIPNFLEKKSLSFGKISTYHQDLWGISTNVNNSFIH